MIKIKKAAMFGLDARIALAIFGALSVISGAALYSAIQNSKATALLTEMNELGKAWEAYLLDTGSDMPIITLASACTVDCQYEVSNLITSTTSGWQGPYIPYQVGSSTLLTNNEKQIVILRLTSDVTWGGATNWPAGDCKTGTTCYVWTVIGGYPDDSLFKVIDEQLDGGDGLDAGSFRWINTGTDPWYSHAFLRYAPVQNPN